MTIRVIFTYCLIAGLATSYIAITLFSATSSAGVHSKSPQPDRVLANQKFNQRAIEYINPIYASIKANDLKAVQIEWATYAKSAAYREDPLLRLAIARFEIQKQRPADAHKHLDLILDPPQGVFSSLQSSGEVMSLWLATSEGESEQRKHLMKIRWENATESVAKTNSRNDPPSGTARVEYFAAQELEAQSKPLEVLPHYERAAILQPGCSFLWKALGNARARAGNKAGAKDAMVRAYWTASNSDRPKIKRYQRLTSADLNAKHP